MLPRLIGLMALSGIVGFSAGIGFTTVTDDIKPSLPPILQSDDLYRLIIENPSLDQAVINYEGRRAATLCLAESYQPPTRSELSLPSNIHDMLNNDADITNFMIFSDDHGELLFSLTAHYGDIPKKIGLIWGDVLTFSKNAIIIIFFYFCGEVVLLSLSSRIFLGDI
ncbi:hypothetical protein [Elstera cyanobacteriorum]|uniref:hypothetical protein n=1 Tax=Elstera cyanobacteriorum TaxID=2022747 RepID=UPI002357B83A|nr:hypothetical protein [Elstera cyanobacteriorum]MCK6441202.1 hypothetical protein [Elstera cyanobacteriorum]